LPLPVSSANASMTWDAPSLDSRSIKALPGLVSDIVMDTYAAWRSDRTLRLGAGLAYYSLFTIVPLLALTAALAEWVFGLADMRAYFTGRLSSLGLVDADVVSQAITDELSEVSVQSSLGIVGGVSLLFASSLVFLALVDAVNVIWDVPVRTGVWHSVRRRLISFLMVVATGGVLIAGVAVAAVTGAAEAIMPGSVAILESLSTVISRLASWAALVVAVTMLFRFIGPIRVSWSLALYSATITSALLYLGTITISWYLQEFAGSSVTGAFGTVLVALSFVYYETQILLAGVQLVKILTLREDPRSIGRPESDKDL
jgi:membrane protein